MKIILDRDETKVDVTISLSRAILELKDDISEWEKILGQHPEEIISDVANNAIDTDRRDIEVLEKLIENTGYAEDDNPFKIPDNRFYQ